MANGFFRRLPVQVDAEELDDVIGQALDGSVHGVPAPEPGGAPPFDPILDALGIRSYGTYMKGTASADIEREDGSVVVTPNRNAGPREGFVGLDEEAVRLDQPSPAALGVAVREALERGRALS